MKPKKVYIVQRFCDKIDIVDSFGNTQTVKFAKKGMIGWSPIYSNKKDAIKHSEKGKYQILTLTTKPE